MAHSEDFYCRYNLFYKGSFTELEFRANGSLKYANRSYGEIIRRNCKVSHEVISQIRSLVLDSGILKRNDAKWPDKDPSSGQEMEIRLGEEHISFTCSNLSSMSEIERFYKKENVDTQVEDDPLGLKAFYYLGLDIKALVMTLIKSDFSTIPL